ncbi:unnamed protein product [Ilex paraguariensis]|uniref:Uncharacterized protein n=1 Tax=Ilex paraguariensis TaxID=185542 RepID=A0ABC8SIN1_9AQUA
MAECAIDVRHEVGCAIDAGHEVGYACESLLEVMAEKLEIRYGRLRETTECAIDVEHEVGYAIDAGHEKFDEEDDNQEPLVEGEGDDSDDWHENKVTEEEWVGTTNNSKKARALTLTNFLITSCVV